jgi:peptidoglycan/xylan/chitin deacetylase (PgdA/CDA1 family)
VLSALCLAATLLAAPDSGPELALTFDDGVTPREAGDQAVRINRAILRALAEAEVRSVLFIAAARADSPLGLAETRAWGEAGHWIGNHSYSHPSLDSRTMPLAAFQADVMRAHGVLAGLPNFVRYFRFPYLHEGDTRAKRDGVRSFLRRAGYRAGGVSIDASDWYYEGRFRQWKRKHPGESPDRFRQVYLDHLWDRARYYEGLSWKALGRSVRHTLLLHTNSLNAVFLPDVIAMFRARGWKVIDPARAFADPIYTVEPDIVPARQSVLWSAARARGIPGLRFPGEDGRYEKPLLDAAGF